MESVTRYFRNAVAASMQGTIDYKKENFFVVTAEELLCGKLSEENNSHIWKREDDSDSNTDEEKSKVKNAIIGLKTLASEFQDGEKTEDNIEEMTSIFFLPLCVNRKRGLFLSEHRRCYDEIIAYCNKLVYEGNLELKRGSFYAAEHNELRGVLPVMGFRQVASAKSQKYAGSRRNREEAEAIIKWLQEKYEMILSCYRDKESFDERGVLGIITPFKSQSSLIKSLIKRRLPKYSKFIDVGTVHTFQGAERKVILFSSVYGKEDGCYFINRTPNLMNVAVSRAKDSFLVFGEKECLTGEEKTAAGLLRRMVFEEGEELR